jgi:hypothetical protein
MYLYKKNLVQTGWVECEQGANEILFVPSGWYHQVTNLVNDFSWFPDQLLLTLHGLESQENQFAWLFGDNFRVKTSWVLDFSAWGQGLAVAIFFGFHWLV